MMEIQLIEILVVVVDDNERATFLVGLTAEMFFEQSDAWYFIRKFMASIMALTNSF